MPDNIIMLDYNEIISTGGKWILLKLVFKQQEDKILFLKNKHLDFSFTIYSSVHLPSKYLSPIESPPVITLIEFRYIRMLFMFHSTGNVYGLYYIVTNKTLTKVAITKSLDILISFI